MKIDTWDATAMHFNENDDIDYYMLAETMRGIYLDKLTPHAVIAHIAVQITESRTSTLTWSLDAILDDYYKYPRIYKAVRELIQSAINEQLDTINEQLDTINEQLDTINEQLDQEKNGD